MTQTNNRLYDEFAKLMTDAAGVAQGMGREVKTVLKGQAERLVGDMDLVKREDFDVVREMVIRAREENAALAAKLAALEARLAKLDGGAAAPAETMVASAGAGDI